MSFLNRSKRCALAPDCDFMPKNFNGITNNCDFIDGASIKSYSTMATTNSNRGAGWTVDMYFYQPAGRLIEKWANRIGLRFGAIPHFIQTGEADDASIRSYSTMATTDSNCGAGWTLDRYFYQRAGRWIETWASRIGLRYGAIPPFIIARRVQDIICPDTNFWIPCVRNRKRTIAFRLRDTRTPQMGTIHNGIDCLLKQMQSPSLYRQAVACTALIRTSSISYCEPYTNRSFCRALEGYLDSKTKSIKDLTMAVLNPIGSKKRRIYSRLLYGFMLEHLESKLHPQKEQGHPSYVFYISAKVKLLRLIESIRLPNYDPVLIVHEACVTLVRCIEYLSEPSIGAEIFYYYMCFLLNLFKHVLQLTDAPTKGIHVLLLPYLHWIDSELPNAFIYVSTYQQSVGTEDLEIHLQFYSLFTLQQTRDLFPVAYVKSGFYRGFYAAAKAQAANDASSFEVLASHVREAIRFPPEPPSSRSMSPMDLLFLLDMEKEKDTMVDLHHIQQRLWGQEWPRFKARLLDERLWEDNINFTSDYALGPVYLGDILISREFDSIPCSSTPHTCSTDGAALFGGNSIPILEFSEHDQCPMTIAFLCKETGRAVYCSVEIPSEDVAVEEEEGEI